MVSETGYGDIDAALDGLAKAEAALASLKEPATAPEASDFLRAHAADIGGFLKELAQWRDSLAGGLPVGGEGKRVLLEGYSDAGAEEALARALEKAGHYFSEYHNVNLTLLGLQALRRGGHRATVEVHITPMAEGRTLHVRGDDVLEKRARNRAFAAQRRQEERRPAHMVFDHFAHIAGDLPVQVPDYFLIDITDAKLLNHMLEKTFLHCVRTAVPPPAPTPEAPARLLVRARKPEAPLDAPGLKA